MTDNAVSDVEEIFTDDGNILSGTSAATLVNGKLIIGTVDQKAMICEVSYLSGSEDGDMNLLPDSYVAV